MLLNTIPTFRLATSGLMSGVDSVAVMHRVAVHSACSRNNTIGGMMAKTSDEQQPATVRTRLLGPAQTTYMLLRRVCLPEVNMQSKPHRTPVFCGLD